MRRRIFLALVMGVALSGAAARAQEGGAAQPQTPPDRVTLEELKAMLAEGRPVLVLDVRGAADKKIKGASHVPLDQLESRLSELPRDKEVVTYCA